MMKTKILFALLLFTVITSQAQQQWQTDFEKAKQTAQKNDQNIILVFQGSDWCSPCIKLNKEVWESEKFQNLNKNHFVMLQADFPRKKANQLSEVLQTQNSHLAETYNNQGFFPLVVVLDKNGKVLGKMGYEKSSPELYFKKLTSFEL